MNAPTCFESPPLLNVPNSDRVRMHTNWENAVQQVHEIALDDPLDGAKRDMLTSAFADPERRRPARPPGRAD
jgi:hypothetical protein